MRNTIGGSDYHLLLHRSRANGRGGSVRHQDWMNLLGQVLKQISQQLVNEAPVTRWQL
jgi:hypothetical protein